MFVKYWVEYSREDECHGTLLIKRSGYNFQNLKSLGFKTTALATSEKFVNRWGGNLAVSPGDKSWEYRIRWPMFCKFETLNGGYRSWRTQVLNTHKKSCGWDPQRPAAPFSPTIPRTSKWADGQERKKLSRNMRCNIRCEEYCLMKIWSDSELSREEKVWGLND